MRKLLLAFTATLVAVSPANAALQVGARAPNFVTTGAVGGRPFRLNLGEQLRKGPVVLYFFPKAFTSGCTAEAHAFSASIRKFRQAGAQVIGMSADDLPTLKRFSVEECRNAFPVATATRPIISAYDVSLPVIGKFKDITNRTSYVIDRRGRIAMAYTDMDFSRHVAKTLAAVRHLR